METVITEDLISLRLKASRFFARLLWLHVPVVAVIARSNGLPVLPVAAIMAGAAAVGTLAARRGGGGALARCVIAAALTMAPILMVYAGSGAWQIDWHMYFFVVFGMLVAYVDWRPIVVAMTLTSLHHLVLAALFPDAVFPESDMARVALHAAMVSVDAVVLLWLVRQMARLFARIATSKGELETRIAERTAEISTLNATLSDHLNELGRAFETLASETAARKEADGRLDHLAHHDGITGLPNRTLLIDRLGQALAAASRGGTEMIVMYLDLDDFKLVNDTLGHAMGDRALAATAARIMRCLRTGDSASRIAGDEFVIVCATLDAVKETPHIAERLIAAIAEPLQLDGTTVNLGATIGVSLFPEDGANPEELIRKADAAMYRAQKAGRNTFRLYTAEVQAEMLAEWQLHRDLQQAIRCREFVLHYQPIVSLTSRGIIGAEALVRWNHPTRGLLAPGEFIAYAEEHGFIGEIGALVLESACAEITRFAAVTNEAFTMAVNISAIQFCQPDFVDETLRILASHDVDRSRLEIEITESVIMDRAESVLSTLSLLSSLDVKLSIDDFGTGYSSLAYLKSFPIHTLKIDRSFVKDIASDPTDQAIAATIIALAHNLGMRVIAEGIETQDQLEQLHLLGADDIQGYLVSRPLCAEDFIGFVREYAALASPV